MFEGDKLWIWIRGQVERRVSPPDVSASDDYHDINLCEVISCNCGPNPLICFRKEKEINETGGKNKKKIIIKCQIFLIKGSEEETPEGQRHDSFCSPKRHKVC